MLSACMSASFSAGNLRWPAGAVDASKRRAIRCRVSRDIEISCSTFLGPKPRIRQQGQPPDRVEGRFGFIPFDAGVFDPEIGIPVLAPICHFVDVEKLNCDVESAHLSVF